MDNYIKLKDKYYLFEERLVCKYESKDDLIKLNEAKLDYEEALKLQKKYFDYINNQILVDKQKENKYWTYLFGVFISLVTGFISSYITDFDKSVGGITSICTFMVYYDLVLKYYLSKNKFNELKEENINDFISFLDSLFKEDNSIIIDKMKTKNLIRKKDVKF